MKVPVQKQLEHNTIERTKKLNTLVEESITSNGSIMQFEQSDVNIREQARIQRNLNSANTLLMRSAKNASTSEQNSNTNLTDNFEYNLMIDLINKGIGVKTLNERIAGFIDNLVRSTSLNDTKRDELELDLVSHFDGQMNLSIIQNLKKDIEAFTKNENYNSQNLSKKIELSTQLLNHVTNKYKLEEAGAIDLISKLGFDYEKEYSHEVLLKTLESTAKNLNLESEFMDLAKIVSEKLLHQAIQSYLNVNYPAIITSDEKDPSKTKFDTAKALSNNTVQTINDFIETDYKREKDKFLAKLKAELDTQSLAPLYRGNSFGSNFEANRTIIEEGNQATVDLFEQILDSFIPKSFGMVSDAISVSLSINPLLAGLNAANVATEIMLANRNLDAQAGLKSTEQAQNAQINTKLAEFKEVIQLLTSSPDIDTSLEEIAQLYSDRAKTRSKIIDQSTLKSTLSSIPGRAGFFGALGIAGVLQKLGLVDGKGVLSYINTSMGAKMNTKILLDLVNNKFPDYVRKINKKDKVISQLNSVKNSGTNQRGVSKLENIRIEVQSVTDKNHRLNDASLTVEPGEFLVIRGESGFGKTTLLEALSGMHEIESGEINIGGINVSSIKAYGEDSLFESLITTNQFPKFIPSKSLKENLEFGVYDKYEKEEIESILDKLGLEKLKERIDEPLNGLSGGQSIRLGIARLALRVAHRKPGQKLVLIMDEPTASLDDDSSEGSISSAERVRNLINEIHKNDTEKEITIICVTHDKALRGLSDRQEDIKNINNVIES